MQPIKDTFRSTISVIDNDKIKMVSCDNGAFTAFAGIANNKAISFDSNLERKNQLLIRAVNNRTRERNYFRKYTELLEGEITEEEFDKEIDENEDDYVVSTNEYADLNDIELALDLCHQLKDVKDVDTMSDLFSFKESSIRESLKTLK